MLKYYPERNERHAMKKSIKAAIFNALLFPGWGQIYLKQYKKGVLIISITAAGILSILWSVFQNARDILKIAAFKKGAVTFYAVIQLAIDSIKSLDCLYLSFIMSFLLMLWIFSILDSYQSDKEEITKPSNSADQQSASPPV